jgi:hypothetical protein
VSPLFWGAGIKIQMLGSPRVIIKIGTSVINVKNPNKQKNKQIPCEAGESSYI